MSSGHPAEKSISAPSERNISAYSREERRKLFRNGDMAKIRRAGFGFPCLL
jgi:hypothetical protein